MILQKKKLLQGTNPLEAKEDPVKHLPAEIGNGNFRL
jgi:hypothetical protein